MAHFVAENLDITGKKNDSVSLEAAHRVYQTYTEDPQNRWDFGYSLSDAYIHLSARNGRIFGCKFRAEVKESRRFFELTTKNGRLLTAEDWLFVFMDNEMIITEKPEDFVKISDLYEQYRQLVESPMPRYEFTHRLKFLYPGIGYEVKSVDGRTYRIFSGCRLKDKPNLPALPLRGK